MAFEYLQETTYTNDLAQQEKMLGYLQEQAASSQQDSDYDLGDEDLIELLTQEDEDEPTPIEAKDEGDIDPDFDEPEIDDTDMDIMSFILGERDGEGGGMASLARTKNVVNQSLSDQGLNPHVNQLYNQLQSKYQVGNLGTWGDSDHQNRKSDHNTGDAIDLSFGGDQVKRQEVVNDLMKDPKTKYIISNGKIWNPNKSQDWRPYTGKDPHTSHIHVSVNRQFGGKTLYADSEETLRRGLNDNAYDQAHLKLKGTNVIRGLDNNQPVAVTDGSKYKVLTGPQDTAKFKGNVYEKRL